MTEPAAREGAVTGTLYQFLATSSSFIAGSLFYIYLAKFYTTTDVGDVALLISTVGIFTTIFSLGLSQAAQHFISFYMGRREESNVRGFIFKTILYGVTSSLMAMISLLLLANPISKLFFHSSSYAGVVMLLSGYLFPFLLFSIFTGVILGMQNFKIAGKISMVTSLLSYTLAGTLLYFYHSPESIVAGWMIGYSVGASIFGVNIYIKTRRYVKREGSFPYKPVFAYSIPIIFSGIIGTAATYIDRFVVAFFINISTLGIYSLALLIVNTISLFLLPLYNVLIPKLSELFSLKDRDSILRGLRVTITLVSFIYVPVALGVASLSDRIMLFLSNKQYLPAAIPAAIFLVISAIFVAGQVFAQAIYSIRKTPILMLSAGATLVSNVGLSIFLIPSYGITGAALANSSVVVVSFTILIWYTRLQGYLSVDYMGILKIWLSAGSMSLIVYLLANILPANTILLGVLVIFGAIWYLIVIRLLKPFREEDKKWLLTMFTGKFRKVASVIDRLI